MAVCKGNILQDVVSTDSTLGQLCSIPPHLVDFILRSPRSGFGSALFKVIKIEVS